MNHTNATTANSNYYAIVTTNDCSTSAASTTAVTVNAKPAAPTATNGGPYCEGLTIQLNASTVTGASYAWTGTNGFTFALQNPSIGKSSTANSGTYSVTATVNSCTSPAGTTTVTVNAKPAAPTATNGGPYCERSEEH